MGSHDQYKLNLRSLTEGEHRYEFAIGDGFFAEMASPLITAGDVVVCIDLFKTSSTHRVGISYSGYVACPCDRCLSEVEIDVEFEHELIIRLGEEYRDEGEDLIILPEQEAVWDMAQTFYEDIVLDLPLQRFHLEGECDEDMLERCLALSVDRVEESSSNIELDEDGVDHRWAALKKLKEN